MPDSVFSETRDRELAADEAVARSRQKRFDRSEVIAQDDFNSLIAPT